MEKNMEFRKLIFGVIIILIGCGRENQSANNTHGITKCKIYNPLPIVKDTIVFELMSYGIDSCRFIVISNLGRDTVSIFANKGSIVFRFKDEQLALSKTAENQYHLNKKKEIPFILEEYISLGSKDLVINHKKLSVYKYHTRTNIYSKGYNVFYTLQQGIVAISEGNIMYFSENCNVDLISAIKKNREREKYFFDDDEVPVTPPLPDIDQ